jgi:hypothetical protein
MVQDSRPVKRRAGRSVSSSDQLGADTTATLPDWGALAGVSRQSVASKRSGLLESVTTARFVRWLFVVAVGATLYVGHVHATQATYERLHALRKENLRLHLERDRLQGQLDHATGPTVIYPKAQEMGLREGFEYGPTLRVSKP